MVVRRIREHVTAHNWFAVGIDLAIVVLGVLIATQVSNWNESRIEAAQGRDYRQRLVRELDFNARQYREQHRYYSLVLKHGLAAVAALDAGADLVPRDFLIDAYQLSQIDTTPPKTYIYDEMVSSGLVSRLGDETIQDIASDYYLGIGSMDRPIREILPYRDAIRAVMPFAIQSAIRRRCGDRLVFFERRIVGVSLPDHCDAVFDRAGAERAVGLIRARPGLREEMTRYVASVDEKLGALRVNADETRRVLARMQGAQQSPSA